MRGNPLFVQKGAPRTAIMHQGASYYIEGAQYQDACWPHAEWTRTPSGKNSNIAGGRLNWVSNVGQSRVQRGIPACRNGFYIMAAHMQW
jgi:hypothetical protein